MSQRLRNAAVLAIVLGTIGCDRATKRLATEQLAGRPARHYLAGTVRLQYVENPGGFLGLGAGLPDAARLHLFGIGTGLLLAVVLAAAVRYRVRGAGLAAIALLWAGGMSNLIDRAVRGSVVDFLNVGIGPLRSGVFNVADVAILTGCLLLLATAHRRPGAGLSPARRGRDAAPR